MLSSDIEEQAKNNLMNCSWEAKEIKLPVQKDLRFSVIPQDDDQDREQNSRFEEWKYDNNHLLNSREKIFLGANLSIKQTPQFQTPKFERSYRKDLHNYQPSTSHQNSRTIKIIQSTDNNQGKNPGSNKNSFKQSENSNIVLNMSQQSSNFNNSQMKDPNDEISIYQKQRLKFNSPIQTQLTQSSTFQNINSEQSNLLESNELLKMHSSHSIFEKTFAGFDMIPSIHNKDSNSPSSSSPSSTIFKSINGIKQSHHPTLIFHQKSNSSNSFKTIQQTQTSSSSIYQAIDFEKQQYAQIETLPAQPRAPFKFELASEQSQSRSFYVQKSQLQDQKNFVISPSNSNLFVRENNQNLMQKQKEATNFSEYLNASNYTTVKKHKIQEIQIEDEIFPVPIHISSSPIAKLIVQNGKATTVQLNRPKTGIAHKQFQDKSGFLQLLYSQKQSQINFGGHQSPPAEEKSNDSFLQRRYSSYTQKKQMNQAPVKKSIGINCDFHTISQQEFINTRLTEYENKFDEIIQGDPGVLGIDLSQEIIQNPPENQSNYYKFTTFKNRNLSTPNLIIHNSPKNQKKLFLVRNSLERNLIL